MQKLKVALLALFSLLLAGCSEPPRGWAFVDGWVRQPPPGMAMTAGFGVLKNDTNQTLEIVAARIQGAGRVEFHRTAIEDGVARMRRVERVRVAPNETVTLAPGGLHLMVMQLKTPLEKGQPVSLTLELASGDTTTASLEVR